MMDHLITKKWVVPKPFQLISSSLSAVSLKSNNASVESSTKTQFGLSNRPTTPNFEVASADRSSFQRNTRTHLSLSSDEALTNFLRKPIPLLPSHPTSSSKQFGRKHSKFRSSISDFI